MSGRFIFSAAPDNDLFRVVTASGIDTGRFDSPEEALRTASRGDALLVLADRYPAPAEAVSTAFLEAARERGIRLFIEYARSVGGLTFGEPRPTQWERAVVASGLFGYELAEGRILALHGCWYLPIVAATGAAATGAAASVTAPAPHLVVARVAGYHRAVYGFPTDAVPVLFELSDTTGPGVLVAATGLSHFVRARYGPIDAWRVIWRTILSFLLPEVSIPALSWEPAVRLTASHEEPLEARYETEAFEKSCRWFADHVLYSIDWKKGAIEGYEAGIDHRGRQLARSWPRGDCIGETAMVFAFDGAASGNPSARQRAGQLLDYVLSAPDFFHDDPSDPAFGLNNWFERGPVFYGDDNARVLMGALTAARLVGDDRWDERIVRCVLANLRTTGSLGFRRPRIDLRHFAEHGDWRFFRGEAHVHYAPHYQAYLWATFLWMYALTGDPELLSKPKQAIRMTMEAYPDSWKWTNGLAQEMARMLLPLAFLVRVEDSLLHRSWLDRIAADLLALQEPCGAIRELLGEPGKGSYGPPRSNEEYGTKEATLIQENGEPACDLLYTTNFAFLGLHEAAAATGDPRLVEAEKRLAEFLCRIQIRSTDQPYLDGAWMRSFDYELWEYWGSSADLGWGAWSVESGWTNSWIAAVLAMRARKTTLFDLSLAPRLRAIYPALREAMFADPVPSKVRNTDAVVVAPGSE